MSDHGKIFINFLNDVHITPVRLTNFGDNTLNKLIKLNIGGIYNVPISWLTLPLQALKDDISGVDVALAVQKGTTLTNNQVLRQFSVTMSDEEPFIARALGGRITPAYLEFYPHGLNEYGKPSKTNMPTFTMRIKAAATAHTAALGAPLTATMVAFETAWKNSRDDQQQQKGDTGDNRADRSVTRLNLELPLLKTIYFIADMFTGDVAKCSSFFDFNLLFTVTKHKHKLYRSPLAALETQQVINRTLTDNVGITIHNTDDNAAIEVWLSATADGVPNGTGIVLQPGQSMVVKASQLGNLANTFMLVKNLSDVNEGAYSIEIVG